MGELPPLDSIAAAFLVVGLLFTVRYLLAIRRLLKGGRKPEGFSYLRLPEAGAFGDEMEPNRRYAARQYWQAAIFSIAGLCLFAWVAVTGTPITLGQSL